jgi:hypothetical protein
MVNSEVIHEIVDALKLDERVDTIPSPIPVVEVSYKMSRQGVCCGNQSGASGTLFLSSGVLGNATQSFYVTQISSSFVKNAACDIASGTLAINLIPDDTGIATNIARIPLLTLTAERGDINLHFRNPLKLQNNSNITLSGTFTAGEMQRTLTAVGFLSSIT